MNLDIFHKNTSFFHEKEHLYSSNTYAKVFNKVDISEEFILDKPELNEFAYKSDTFKENHEGLHLLFTGCSVTWGTGLLKEERWTRKLFEKINKETKCSGYFNISFPGNGIQHQVFNIIKYCSLYGKPNYIFYNMPDVNRFYYYNEKSKSIGDAFFNFKDETSYEFIKLLNFQYYLMLHEYCKSNNIKLYSFTWAYYPKNVEALNESTISKFDSFYEIDQDEINNFVLEYSKENKNDKYVFKARDKDHHGTGYHQYWANIMYEKYLDSL